MSELAGHRIAVLMESEFVPGEIEAYQREFPARGATVDLVSRLWGNSQLTFVSDVEREGEIPQTVEIGIDIGDIKLAEYSAVIMAANYTSVRLRMFDPPVGPDGQPLPVEPSMARDAPAVQLFAAAMRDRRIVKGALCHGLWLLTPVPELLSGRRVICHRVVLADIANAGAVYTPSRVGGASTPLTPFPGVVVDDDLVTGETWHDVVPFIDAVTQQVLTRS